MRKWYGVVKLARQPRSGFLIVAGLWHAEGMDEQEIGRSPLEVFAEVPDPRHPCRRRHPLAALLALSTAAILCGAMKSAARCARPAAIMTNFGSSLW